MKSLRLTALALSLALVGALIPLIAPLAAGAQQSIPGPEVSHVVSCLAGAGRVDTNIVNTTTEAAAYRIEFEGLSARQTTVDAGDWWRMPITGRPDDFHTMVVKRDGAVISDLSLQVQCAALPEPADESPTEVQIVNACREDNGYLLFQFNNPSDEQRGYVIAFDGVPNRSTSAAAFGQSVRAVTGRPDGTYGWTIRTNGVVTHSGSEQIACDPIVEPPEGEFVALPPQPDGVAFPTVAWPTDDLPIGADSTAVDTILATAFGAAGRSAQPDYGQIEGALVVQGGEVIVEQYGNGYAGTSPHVSWSVAKSVTHALLGILAGEDQLDMFAPAVVPEWTQPNDVRAQITPDMLARMSSGLDWNETFDAPLVVFTAGLGSAAAVQAQRDLVAPVGGVFEYSTGSTAINGRLMGDIVGRGSVFEAWADAELFDPLGIDSVVLEFDATDNWIAGYGANMTARDFARFGLLYMRDGVWDGQRILPEGWVDYARTPSVTKDDYGSGFWLERHGPDTFSAVGFRGQLVVVDPTNDLIVVILADGDTTGSGAMAKDLIEAIVPAASQ